MCHFPPHDVTATTMVNSVSNDPRNQVNQVTVDDDVKDWNVSYFAFG